MAPSLGGSYFTRLLSGGAAKSTMYPDHPRTLNELKTAITVYIRNISQADLQKLFANKIKWVQACMDARGSLSTPFISAQQLFEHTLFRRRHQLNTITSS
jgi:hypothetical protein